LSLTRRSSSRATATSSTRQATRRTGAYRGDALSAGGAILADMTPLAFYVDDNRLHFHERQPEPWSQLVYRRARAGAR